MNRHKNIYARELLLAKDAAKKAGDYLIQNKSTLNTTLFSNKKDIKLKADISAENLIKNIISSNSSIPILAEESGMSSDNVGKIFWVVDPLDGTANFSRDIPICCVSIALVEKLKPIMGVIYDFNNKDLYEGSIYSKAAVNDQEISVSKVSNPEDGILITGLPNATNYSNNALLEMIKNFQDWRKVRMIGSAAMASAYIASGKADFYTEKTTYLWDVAAGAAIINAAGGRAIISNKNDKFQVDVSFSNSTLKL
jgi:myo-inositol-1(or 4)-monophosphatase